MSVPKLKFVREIPESRINNNVVLDLEQFGFTLIYTKDSVEVWAEVASNG